MSFKTKEEELSALERTAERFSGVSADELRDLPIDVQRYRVEEVEGHKLVFTRRFPFVGRGNVMGDRTKSGAEVNKELDAALESLK